MSLEDKIDELTAAILDNTAALNATLEQRANLVSEAKALREEKAPAKKTTKVEEDAVEEDAAPAKKATKAPAKKATKPEPEPEVEEDASEAEVVTRPEVNAAAVAYMGDKSSDEYEERRAAIKSILKKHGAEALKDIAEDKLASVLAKIKELSDSEEDDI